MTALPLLLDRGTEPLVLTRSAHDLGGGRVCGEAGFEVSVEATEPSGTDCSEPPSAGRVESPVSETFSTGFPRSEDMLVVFPLECRESDGRLGITGTTGSIFPPFRELDPEAVARGGTAEDGVVGCVESLSEGA